MDQTLCVIFTVIFLLEGITGWPKNSLLENEQSKPLADLNYTLARVLTDFNDKMSELKLGSNPTVKANIDACHDLRASLDTAHAVANKAALLTLQVLAGLSNVLGSVQECFTTNPFWLLSCSAHKLKDGKDVYKMYKDQIQEQGAELSQALKKVFYELVQCFKIVTP